MSHPVVVRARTFFARFLRPKGLLIGTVLAVSIPTAALAGAGVGGVFNLGVTNTVSKLTTLAGTTSKMLQVTNKSGSSSAVAIGATSKGHGAPAIRATNTGGGPALGLSVKAGAVPFTVNSAAKVAKLNADLIDGKNATDFQRSYTHTVVVSPGATPTDGGTALLNALAGITDASSTNPYLVKLEPGVYDVGTTAVSMQQYVDIEGSGEDTTTITGSQGTQTLHPQANSELRSVTVVATAGGAAILANNGSPRLSHVTAISTSADSSKTLYGIYVYGSSPLMTDVTAIATTTGSGMNGSRYGVYDTNGASPVMTDVTASATGGQGSGGNSGVYNLSSSPTMTLVQASASDASVDVGIENVTSSSPIMTFDTATATSTGAITIQAGVHNSASSPTIVGLVATASGGSGGVNIGVWNEVASLVLNQIYASASGGATTNRGVEDHALSSAYTVKINNSVVVGSTATIDNSSNYTTDVGDSQLAGGAVSPGGGTLTCVGAYSGSYAALNGTCT